jgi:anti-anti-sigma regulatory factor
MWQSFQNWLTGVQLHDPIERRQASLVQAMLIGLLVAVLPGLPLILAGRSEDAPLVPIILPPAMVAGAAAAALVLVRRGRFRAGVLTATLGLLLTATIYALRSGVSESPTTVLAMAISVTMAGLLLRRRGLLAIAGLSVLSVGAIAYLESGPTPLIDGSSGGGSWGSVVAGYVLEIGLLGVFFDRFGSSLRDALASSQARERELEQLKAGLEETVAGRTAELQASVDQLQASQATIRELGAPVLPVLPGVLVAPIVGALDSARAAHLSQAVLAAIDRTRARAVILDITGVPVVDSQVAQALLGVAAAARLLGAEALLVGVGAEVAQTIVQLGVDLGTIRVFPNLQEAILALLPERVSSQ